MAFGLANDRPQSAIIAADMETAAIAIRGASDGQSSRRRSSGDRSMPRPLRRVVVVSLALVAVAAAIFLAGFLRFAHTVATLHAPPDVSADGIVVLTGGADRIAGGMGLLSAGRAGRMLISGVHPDTQARDIGRIVGASSGVFDCCVDLDHAAIDTVGNAEETAKWARSNDIESLIVVTSAYHMPRSMMELGRALPDRALVAFPVARPGLDLDHWYLDPAKIRLLLVEYVKYTAAQGRAAVESLAP
jgi:uncharacterized SAM-binding protein YcdF (DUF218 family)